MALFDFLKRKKETAASKKSVENKTDKVLAKKISPAKDTKIEATKEIKLKSTKIKAAKGFSYNVVKEPHISEKATYLAKDNKYIFKVYNNTNKPEIKKSIEGIHGVNVLSVNIIKIAGKKRRLGKIEGFKKGHAKAIVTIKEGQKIEIF
ncbi:MAG: 50S ribosomal protein L23 [Parcubacteria group bacterium GW2011_GWA2_33_14]|nr:MAG: 50S ribosomal protein L23 [Parcubacteria group bacterium GW2011_GWA2_33_14]